MPSKSSPFWPFRVKLVFSFCDLVPLAHCLSLLQQRALKKWKSMEQKNLVHDHPAYHLTFWNILLYPIFSRSDPCVISMLWKKLNKENTISSHRIMQCSGVMIVSKHSNSRKNRMLFIWNLLLRSPSILVNSIYFCYQRREHVRINIRIIKMK